MALGHPKILSGYGVINIGWHGSDRIRNMLCIAFAVMKLWNNFITGLEYSINHTLLLVGEFSSQISYLTNKQGFGLNVFQFSTLVSLNDKCFLSHCYTSDKKKKGTLDRWWYWYRIVLSCLAFIKTFFVLLLLSDLSILIFSRCLSYCLLMAS